jgi:hypothetical protein
MIDAVPAKIGCPLQTKQPLFPLFYYFGMWYNNLEITPEESSSIGKFKSVAY